MGHHGNKALPPRGWVGGGMKAAQRPLDQYPLLVADAQRLGHRMEEHLLFCGQSHIQMLKD
jgi:hypothetical protein